MSGAEPPEPGSPEGQGGALEWVPVAGRALEAVAYDVEAQQIHVIYKGGSEGVFDGTLGEYEALRDSGSPGSIVNQMMGRG